MIYKNKHYWKKYIKFVFPESFLLNYFFLSEEDFFFFKFPNFFQKFLKTQQKKKIGKYNKFDLNFMHGELIFYKSDKTLLFLKNFRYELKNFSKTKFFKTSIFVLSKNHHFLLKLESINNNFLHFVSIFSPLEI